MTGSAAALAAPPACLHLRRSANTAVLVCFLLPFRGLPGHLAAVMDLSMAHVKAHDHARARVTAPQNRLHPRAKARDRLTSSGGEYTEPRADHAYSPPPPSGRPPPWALCVDTRVLRVPSCDPRSCQGPWSPDHYYRATSRGGRVREVIGPGDRSAPITDRCASPVSSREERAAARRHRPVVS